MIKVISVKFKSGGKAYFFDPGDNTYERGAGVIVETAKGLEYAVVSSPVHEVDDSEVVAPLKPVVRAATEKETEQVRRNQERRLEYIKTAQQKADERQLNMKMVDCEMAFDGSKTTIYFTAETRVDFRELIKDLSAAFHSRIELRQIGIRDEIKILGGMGPCGRECCCVNCMTEPQKVSVKMAKNQGLSLNPVKISGLCGRLMCCLSYENDYYSEVCKKVPKIGSEVQTAEGDGVVVNVNMLQMTVKVKIEKNDSVSYHDFPVDNIRFMRGNVPMGRQGDFQREEPEQEQEPQFSAPDEQPKEEREERGRREHRGHGDRKNNGKRGAPQNQDEPRNNPKGNGDRHRPHGNNNRPDGRERKNGEGEKKDRRQESPQLPADARKPRHKHRGHGGRGGQNGQGGQPQK